MNLLDIASDDATAIFLNVDDGSAELVTHNRRGKPADAEQIAALVFEEKPKRDLQAGAENTRTLRVRVATTVSVTKESTWVIRGEEWQTQEIGTVLSGLLKFWVFRRDPGQQTKGRPKL